MARKKAPAQQTQSPPAQGESTRVYTLVVLLVGGPVTEEFVEKNPVVSRTITILGRQTLQHLHRVIYDAFDRWDEHLYEFQIGGKGPMDPKARKYVQPESFADSSATRPAGRVDQSTLDSLGLKEGDAFGYWFDFGDDWWHKIEVETIEEKQPAGEYPRVTKRVGKSPPQYADVDDEE